MKKQTVISFLTVLCFLLVTWLPCQAEDNALYICKNKKTDSGMRHLVSGLDITPHSSC